MKQIHHHFKIIIVNMHMGTLEMKTFFKSRECKKKVKQEKKKEKENFKLLKMKNSTSLILASMKCIQCLMFSLSSYYFDIRILAISCFHCLQNDDVIEFDRFCQLIRISTP